MTLRNLTAVGVDPAGRLIFRMPQPHDDCEQCRAYLAARRAVIARAIGQRVSRDHDIPADVLHRLLAGVHDRHQLGLPILPIPAGSSPASVAYRQTGAR